MRHSLKLSLLELTTAAALALCGCNGMDGLGGSSSGSGNQSATGVWSGADAVSELALTAFINSSGQSTFIRSDGVLFTGTTQVSGSNLVAVSGTSSSGTQYGIVSTLTGS